MHTRKRNANTPKTYSKHNLVDLHTPRSGPQSQSGHEDMKKNLHLGIEPFASHLAFLNRESHEGTDATSGP